MKIDGKAISSKIQEKLKKDISRLSSKKIFPVLSVVLVGNNPSSVVYVNQKRKLGKILGVKVEIQRFDPEINPSKLKALVKNLNGDPLIHGIIIQRPLPTDIPGWELNRMVLPQKDVDGFHPNSVFDPPIALAVMEILKSLKRKEFAGWIKNRRILVIGRGDTAGKPIAKYFSKNNLQYTVAHSKTKNLVNLALSSDIVVSCVGKRDIVRHTILKKGAVLIGVGLHPEESRLAADYVQAELEGKNLYYTPVPGGVGPVNVTMLMSNVIKAAILAGNQ